MRRHPQAARLALALACAALGATALAGCGGSAPKGPADLIFVSTRDGDYAIFGADADGNHVRRLTKEKGDPASPAGLFFQVDPAWSPDGQRIAFASRRDGTDHIYVMDADGTNTRQVTTGAQDDLHPSWSPDGKRIVFAREGALFVVAAQGGKATRVGRGPGNAADPSWSPDGAMIVYDYRRPGTPVRELWVMRADGTGIRQLTRLGNTSGWPSWSPDGKRIAFHSNAHGGYFQIFTVGLAGKTATQVTQASTDVIQPDWAPDGKTLVFSRDGALWIDTGDRETQLTPAEDNDSAPDWRPVQAQ